MNNRETYIVEGYQNSRDIFLIFILEFYIKWFLITRKYHLNFVKFELFSFVVHKNNSFHLIISQVIGL